MARAGLGPSWTCLFANEIDAKKALAYRANWGGGAELRVADVAGITAAQAPGVADLAWASFPCQDLSLAGAGAGLEGARSGTFHAFWRIVKELVAEGRAPRIVVLENVCGTLTRRAGRDFQAICAALTDAGYRHGALVVNAALFTPQSRPRLFLIAVRSDVRIDPTLLGDGPGDPFHTPALRKAVDGLGPAARSKMLWWRTPAPAVRAVTLADLIETHPLGVRWHTPAQTARLLGLMSPANLAKVKLAGRSGGERVGAVYRRTRADERGIRSQRAEVRFDDLAGCLRTPAGGSSRQAILFVHGLKVRSRLISPRETARLMGLADSYRLPENGNDAYHLTGDGVAVPVVRHLARHILEPLLATRTQALDAA